MKIVISRKQWEQVGLKSGWMKKADMEAVLPQEKINAQPSPSKIDPSISSAMSFFTLQWHTPQDYINEIIGKIGEIMRDESEETGVSKEQYLVRESKKIAAIMDYKKKNNNQWVPEEFLELLNKIHHIEGSSISSTASKKLSLKAIAEKIVKSLKKNLKSN